MIWLLIPLIIGVGLVSARVVFDMQKAHADAAISHQATDMYLSGAMTATTGPEAAAHVSAASTANQVAATKTMEIAQNATTPRDKQVAALMAQLTEVNRRQIDLMTALMMPPPPPAGTNQMWGQDVRGLDVARPAQVAAWRANIAQQQAQAAQLAAQLKGQLAVLGVSV